MSEAYSVARPRIAHSGIGIYPLLSAQVTSFFQDLWVETLFETFNYKIFGNPMDGILALKWYYGLGNTISYTELNETCNLVLGNVTMPNIQTKPCVQEIVETPRIHFGFRNDMGESNPLNAYSNYGLNYTDYSPYTSIDIFLPFIGFVSMDPAMLYGRKLDLFYRINLLSGEAVALIEDLTDPYNTFMIFNQSCNVATECPVNITAMKSMENILATTVGKAVVAGTAIAATGGIAGAGGLVAGGLISNAVSSTIGSIGQSNRGVSSGGFNSDTGALSPLNPSMIIRRHNSVEASNDTVGKPSGEVKLLSTCSGYVEIFAVQSQTQFSKYDDEIIQLLKDGVYL